MRSSPPITTAPIDLHSDSPLSCEMGVVFCSFHGFLCSSPPSAVFRLPDPRCPAAFSRLPVRCLSPLYPSDFTLFCMILPLPQNIPTMHDPENPLRRKKSAVLRVSWNRGFSNLFQTLYGEDEAVHQTGYLLCSLYQLFSRSFSFMHGGWIIVVSHQAHCGENQPHQDHAQSRVKQRDQKHEQCVLLIGFGYQHDTGIVTNQSTHQHRGHYTDGRL